MDLMKMRMKIRTGLILLLFCSVCDLVMAQTRIVTGQVMDESQDALPGVNITIKGTTQGVVSGADGTYSISVQKSDAVLVFSYIGFREQEKPASDQTVINVTMTELIEAIDEVVVVGYGTQKKETLSGAVTSMRGSDVLKTPAMNVSNSLAGNLPGLVVVARSGEPGNDYSNLYIRGRSSLNNNNPLIVVDGVPNRSLDRIDPATIESISVLKDASAAIYGSQAANGVILVTTKRGKNEKLNVAVNLNQGWSRPTKVPEVTNSYEFATLVNEVNYYRDRQPEFSPDALQKYGDGSDLWRYPDTDWAGVALKPWSPQTIANISLSGGADKLRTYVALSARSQDGFFKNSASKYAQYDLRANIDGQVNDYISLAFDFGGRMEDANFPTSSSAGIFRSLSVANPTLVAKWPNGLIGPPLDIQNQTTPIVGSTPLGGYDKRNNYVFNINAKVNIKIPGVEGLKFTGTAAIDRGLNYRKKFSKRYTLYTWDGYATDATGLPELTGGQYGGTPSLQQQSDIYKSYLLNALLNYDRTIAEVHAINILVGVEAIENSSNWFSAERRSFTSEFPEELNFGASNSQYAFGSNPGINRWMNYFGRVNYAYMNKYLLEFVWRYQGSSKFATDTRWGFFPGISAGYRLSEESFWKSSLGDYISNFKIRASWGKTGNDLIDPYQFYSLYAKPGTGIDFVTGDGTNNSTIGESRAANLIAQWEEARQTNIGLDLNFLNNRLSVTVDYFNNLRKKILIPQLASVPEMTGMSGILPDINLGKVRNSGFDFNISFSDRQGDFSYRIGLNGGYAKNKIIFFDEAAGALDWQVQTGHPMFSSLLYKAQGIYHTQADVDKWNAYAREKTGNADAEYYTGARTGDIIFEDVDGNGVINGDDKERIYKSVVPTWTGGLNLSFGYQNLDLSVLLNGQLGAVRLYLPSGSTEYNYTKDFYDKRWTESNPTAEYPRTYNRNEEYWMSSENLSTFWLHKTDFIRLRNFELGYNLPHKWLYTVGITDLRIFAGGMNIFTIAPDMIDYDPETQFETSGLSGEGYPLQKMINVGFSLKF
ncbi:MAG: TonB-dependent receptor [Tannerella sp.]|jgi:TonB-linked SusC/RagA family outer membrane protein|nr:TonB-dependent receptor [Tannerella sp.]